MAGQPLTGTQALGILVLFPLMFACRGYIGYLSSYCMGWVSERVVNDLRQDVFRKLSTLSLDFYNRATMGDLITHVHGDTQSLQKTLNLGVSDMVKEPVTVVFTFAFLLWLDWQLTLFAMAFLPLCLFRCRFLEKKCARQARATWRPVFHSKVCWLNSSAAFRLIKAYKLEEQATARFAEHARRLVHHGMKQIQAKEMINPLIETIGMLGLGVVLVYILVLQKSGADLALIVGAIATVYTNQKNCRSSYLLSAVERRCGSSHAYFE
jgi:subfamily B ATP-binding cassette protein MsbA